MTAMLRKGHQYELKVGHQQAHDSRPLAEETDSTPLVTSSTHTHTHTQSTQLIVNESLPEGSSPI